MMHGDIAVSVVGGVLRSVRSRVKGGSLDRPQLLF